MLQTATFPQVLIQYLSITHQKNFLKRLKKINQALNFLVPAILQPTVSLYSNTLYNLCMWKILCPQILEESRPLSIDASYTAVLKT